MHRILFKGSPAPVPKNGNRRLSNRLKQAGTIALSTLTIHLPPALAAEPNSAGPATTPTPVTAPTGSTSSPDAAPAPTTTPTSAPAPAPTTTPTSTPAPIPTPSPAPVAAPATGTPSSGATPATAPGTAPATAPATTESAAPASTPENHSAAETPTTPESTFEPGKTTATFTGRITDLPREHGINEAHVVLTKPEEEHKRFETETKNDGSFKIDGLEPGEWIVTISAKEMLSHTVTVKLAAGETRTMTIGLEDVEPVDVLRISGKRTLIHPEKIGSTTNVDHRIVDEYESGNDLRSLVVSTPGVMSDSLGNIITRGEHNSINYEIDGVVLPEAAGVLQQSQFVSPRSLQSMQVDIGGYEASDGGGPLGAVVRMRTLPILAKPMLTVGEQIGGPMAGSIFYNGSTAVSQDPNSKWYRVRIESSGSFGGTSMGLAPPVKDYVHNNRANINCLTKIEWTPTELDTIKLDIGINHSFLQVPISRISYDAGVRQDQHDAQDFTILSYRHRFTRFLDDANLHILNNFYYENYGSRNVFDPDPVINGGQPLQSIAPHATRFDYAFGVQGDVNKVIWSHHLKAGILTEVRPVTTNFNATYYNNNPNLPGVPYGAVISPFTGLPGGPSFSNPLGRFNGMRYLQSAYLQDSWRPSKGFLRRLTVDAGIRFDLYHGVFGNTERVEDVLATIPGVPAFSSAPFGTQRVTDAQASGRYGLAYVLTKNTVWRASYSDLFVPPPVDIFSTPPDITQLINGVFNGTVRPLSATRGRLVDTSIETQVGPRFVTRTNLFYKVLSDFGDSGVIGNSPLYNRQEISGQKADGVETRLDLKPSRDGTGFYGFVSSTVQLALLTGSKQVLGGIYDIQTTPIEDVFPDHDRRFFLTSALGYQAKSGWWILPEAQFLTGLQDERNEPPPHPTRTPFLFIMGLNGGYKVPKAIRDKYKGAPTNIDLRMENLLNNRLPTNLGSPFQGTRFLLPFRFLIECAWQLGQQQNDKTSGLPGGKKPMAASPPIQI